MGPGVDGPDSVHTIVSRSPAVPVYRKTYVIINIAAVEWVEWVEQRRRGCSGGGVGGVAAAWVARPLAGSCLGVLLVGGRPGLLVLMEPQVLLSC
ncbi:unnamed protein product [Merluccius merluccius]